MRITYRFAQHVTIDGKTWPACVRVLQPGSAMTPRGFGEMADERVRLLLPFHTPVQPRALMRWAGRAYRCAAVRAYPGHLQADFIRCAP
ncbi:MAG: hypothetical protein MR021_07635 [Clostridiales bacterium]|nr:hypothetical protein [Clostridiales bacterium]